MSRSVAEVRRSWVASIAASALVLLLLAQSVMAASWSEPIALSTPSGGQGDLVTLPPSTAVVIYDAPFDGVYIRRSTNGGLTWSSGLLLGRWGGASADGTEVAIAGRGATVDAVWTDSRGRVRYARSFDGGASFEPPAIVGAHRGRGVTGPHADNVDVARGPDGLVAIAWQHYTAASGIPNVRVRVSTDGGATFGTAASLGTGAAYRPQLAAGNGVLYLAYTSLPAWDSPWLLRVHRSTSAGKSWGQGVVLDGQDANYGVEVSLAAAGNRAFIVYTYGFHVVYRRTANSGRDWSARTTLVSRESGAAVVSLKSGVVRVLFDTGQAVEYTQSNDGTNWTPAEVVATAPSNTDSWPVGVGFAGRRLALHVGWECPAVECTTLYVSGSP